MNRTQSRLFTFTQRYGTSKNITQIYSTQKVILKTKIKKGFGKGKPRVSVIYKRSNSFDNLTFTPKEIIDGAYRGSF